MKRDDRVCLMEWETGWAGWVGNKKERYYEPAPYTEKFETRFQAVKWAHSTILAAKAGLQDVTLVGRDEQESALNERISNIQDCSLKESLKTRLDNLIRWGTQFPLNNDLNVC